MERCGTAMLIVASGLEYQAGVCVWGGGGWHYLFSTKL